MLRKSCKNPALMPLVGRRIFNQSGLLHVRMIRFVAFCSIFALSSPIWGVQAPQDIGATPGLTKDQIQDGWVSLFDGQTLFGWKPVSQADWKVENGEIRVGSGEPGLLRTTAQFDDFEMTLEFKADARTNSGVFLRSSPDPKNVLSDCYELNIADRQAHPYPTGSLVARSKCDLENDSSQWHQFRILADGPKIKVWLDDEKASEYLDPNPIGRGYIGLQLNSGQCAFRNISIKPINNQSLFDGTDLAQWNTAQSLDSKFEVTDDRELRMIGGRGQLESKAQFRDFTFSMLCKTNREGLNSGVFFRSIPGQLMNGYESQIQNQFKNGDRTQPLDCGTGGIFRRIDARRVNANDNEWFRKTIIATGPHVSVWVNGYQVTDWTDGRQPDPNPRKGRRLDKGTIIFQGHDPTTDILIKDIYAKEIVARRPEK
jgi:hypothetical protein